jgi:integrase
MRTVHVGLCKLKDRKNPWRVRWKPRNSKKYTTEFYPTKQKATQRKFEIEEFENGNRDLSKSIDYEEIREIKLKLNQTENEKANGKSLGFAVDWFLENYQGGDELLETKEYYKEYKKIKLPLVSVHTIRDDEQYIGLGGEKSFTNLYGHMKPTEFTREFIQEYLDSNTSKFHRKKALGTFFKWLCGESKYHNDNPCLRKNPMKGVLVEFNSDFSRNIATNQEICDLLRLANSKEYNFSAGRWAFLFFTGMRPSEADRFWDPKLKLGWKNINLVDQQPYIFIDKRVIQKKGLPARKIKIRKGFFEMLKVFKAQGEKRYPMRVRNWRRIYSDLRKKIFGDHLSISRDKDEAKDIARHTFVSNLYLYEKNIAIVTGESGDNESTLKKHYINPLLSEGDAKRYFEEIGLKQLINKVVMPTNDDSPLDQLIQINGEQILHDSNFINAWSGGEMIAGLEKAEINERINLLQNHRRKLAQRIRGGQGIERPKIKKRGGEGLDPTK